MALYRYIKTYPKKKYNQQFYSFGFIFFGVIMMMWVLWPILSFQFSSADIFARTITPVSENSAGLKADLPHSVVAAAGSNEDSSVSTDFSNPNLWFPDIPQKRIVTPVNSYTLTIPKLNIKEATVIIAGDELSKNLIHYGGTALPGEYGTTVIFGHSTLPQLYDPKNYLTIFSTLPTLKPAKDISSGDEIFIKYDGAVYKYMIYDMVVTKPEDLSSLEQEYDNSYLTLVTCVPPGTYWKRLNVKAKLMPLE